MRFASKKMWIIVFLLLFMLSGCTRNKEAGTDTHSEIAAPAEETISPSTELSEQDILIQRSDEAVKDQEEAKQLAENEAKMQISLQEKALEEAEKDSVTDEMELMIAEAQADAAANSQASAQEQAAKAAKEASDKAVEEQEKAKKAGLP